MYLGKKLYHMIQSPIKLWTQTKWHFDLLRVTSLCFLCDDDDDYDDGDRDYGILYTTKLYEMLVYFFMFKITDIFTLW